jgi:hypothetical protein
MSTVHDTFEKSSDESARTETGGLVNVIAIKPRKFEKFEKNSENDSMTHTEAKNREKGKTHHLTQSPRPQ